MAIVNIISPGTVGVDMRVSKLLLGNTKAHFARNLSFDENTVETRNSIDYIRLNIEGDFLTATYHDPKDGLNAVTEVTTSEQLVVVTTTGIYCIPSVAGELGTPVKVSSVTMSQAYAYSAENYAIVVGEGERTIWIDQDLKAKKSKGTTLDSDGSSHDTFVTSNFEHYLPNETTTGIYIHGRNLMSISIGVSSSVLLASDIIGKRQCDDNSDILLMEEQAVFSDPIGAPSSIGKTVALAKMNTGSFNGEGEVYDFRETGIVRHNTIVPRETRFEVQDGKLVTAKNGWDKQRISNVALNSVTATGIRAVTELPLDIAFRSEYGLHFLKTVLGEGTFNDPTTNTFSQDVEPLLDMDERLDKALTGHWLKGNRLFATTGINELGISNAFVVINQALTFSEDRTPRFGAEGAWQTDTFIENINQFVRIGKKKADYGFIVTDQVGSIYYGQFKDKRGYDTREGVKVPVSSTYMSGQFVMSGLRTIDAVSNGELDAIINSSTKSITISVRSNTNEVWTEWKRWDLSSAGPASLSDTLNQPPDNTGKGSFLEFKIDTIGYIKIIGFDVEVKTIQQRKSLKSGITPITQTIERYLE